MSEIDIRVGDLVTWDDEPYVLGRVTAVTSSGRVEVEFSNGSTEAAPGDLYVARAADAAGGNFGGDGGDE